MMPSVYTRSSPRQPRIDKTGNSPPNPLSGGQNWALTRQTRIDRRHSDRMAAKAEAHRIRQLEAEAKLATVQHRKRIAEAGQGLASEMQVLADGAPVDARWVQARLGQLGVLALQAGDLG